MTGNTGKFSLDCPGKEHERKMIRKMNVVSSFFGCVTKGMQTIKGEIGDRDCFIVLMF